MQARRNWLIPYLVFSFSRHLKYHLDASNISHVNDTSPSSLPKRSITKTDTLIAFKLVSLQHILSAKFVHESSHYVVRIYIILEAHMCRGFISENYCDLRLTTIHKENGAKIAPTQMQVGMLNGYLCDRRMQTKGAAR